MSNKISRKNLERLPKYHRRALGALSEGRESIASRELAELLNIDESLVRRDLAAVNIAGKPRVGYNLTYLCRHLAEALGYGEISRGVIIGAGHLGTAIANYPGFPRMGLHIIALFDNSLDRIGFLVGKRRIQDIRQLPTFLKRQKPEVGIITVPAVNAQLAADKLVAGGILGIWDFSGARLRIPDGIVMSHADLAAEWSVLSHQLKNRKLT